ncbi:MAG: DUF2226 domain-containing protein [Archaeoglobaceae archaeon]|nr:DUF2226 domain-containing protein [Archaeoglobaceae archaeon]MDW8127839.1 DUF2226 domain-containing protein [Archaeoglobaceae archaeon]
MILPKVPLTKIEKGRLEKVLENLTLSKFSGYIKVGFKRDELCSAEVLLDGGKILAAEVIKVRSRTSIYGDDALSEISDLDNTVVEIYVLNADQIKKAIDLNKSAFVSERGLRIIERSKIIDKYKIPKPDEKEIEKAITESVGNSELAFEIEREKVLRKYGITRPSDEEVDYLISNALGELEVEETREGQVTADFDNLRKEIVDLLYSEIGKPSKKAVSIIESCKSYEELIKRGTEIDKALKTLVMFIPREKIDGVIAKIEQKIGRKLT